MPDTSVAKLKTWTSQHERIVLLSLGGKNQREIGKLLGVSREHVNITLKDPRAVKIKSDFMLELRERLMVKFDDQILDLAEYALKNLGRTLREHVDPEMLGKKQHQDKMSVEVLRMAGLGYTDRGAGPPVLALTKEESEALMAAVRMSDRVKEIHGGSYEVLDDEPNGKGEVAD